MSGVEAAAAGWAAAATLGYVVCDALTRAAVRRLRRPAGEEEEPHQTPPEGADHQLTATGASDTADAPPPTAAPSEYRGPRWLPALYGRAGGGVGQPTPGSVADWRLLGC